MNHMCTIFVCTIAVFLFKTRLYFPGLPSGQFVLDDRLYRALYFHSSFDSLVLLKTWTH